MDRATTTIKLAEFDVKVFSSLNWGEKETLQSEIMKGAKINDTGFQEFDTGVLLNTKYKMCELLVTEIKNKKGEVIPYSKEWLNNLSIPDGDLLMDKFDVIEFIKKKV